MDVLTTIHILIIKTHNFNYAIKILQNCDLDLTHEK